MNSVTSQADISTTTGRIAFIQSCWHKDIVNQGKIGFLNRIGELSISSDLVDFFELPGAFEIPLKCKQLCKTEKYVAIIAAGLVVNGDIYQHEFVAQAVISGLMQVQLEQEIPILSMVLSPKEFDESKGTNDFFTNHFLIKGAEAANALHALLE